MSNYFEAILGGLPIEYRSPDFRLIADETGNWYCGFRDSLVHEIRVPSSTTAEHLVVRLHELLHGHLHKSLKRMPKGIEGEVSVALADAEVHAGLFALLPPRARHQLDQVMGQHCQNKLSALERGHCSPINAANFAIRTLAQGAGSIVDQALTLAASVGIDERAIVNIRYLGRRMGYLLSRKGISAAIRCQEYRVAKRELREIIKQIMAKLHDADTAATNALTQLTQTKALTTEVANRQVETELGGTPKPTSSGSTHQKLEIVSPPLTISTAPQGQARRYAPLGGRLSRRAVQALAAQKSELLFSRTRLRGFAGTVLIDASGSMRLTHEELAGLIEKAPLGQVAFYSGRDRWGQLVIAARNGRRAADLAQLALTYRQGGNEVDFLAIQWLLRQPAPRVLVTDQQFVFSPANGETVFDAAALELLRRARMARLVHVVRTLDELPQLVSSL